MSYKINSLYYRYLVEVKSMYIASYIDSKKPSLTLNALTCIASYYTFRCKALGRDLLDMNNSVWCFIKVINCLNDQVNFVAITASVTYLSMNT